MNKINIKPLSVNQSWQGRRFRTPKYNKYISDMMFLLPKIKVPDGPIELNIIFGFSSASSDIDNPLKPFIDCLQKRYNFNDKMIKRLVVEVEKVEKGDEFIEFNIKRFN